MALTKKQEAFVLAYIKTGSPTDAYRAAYDVKNATPKSVNEMASRLLKNVKIASRVEELVAPALKKAAMDAEQTILELAGIAKQTPAKGITYSDKINALALLAKHHGLFEKDNKQRAESLSLEVVLVSAKR